MLGGLPGQGAQPSLPLTPHITVSICWHRFGNDAQTVPRAPSAHAVGRAPESSLSSRPSPRLSPEWEWLWPALLRTPPLSHSLQKNTIGPLGAQQTADALKQNRSLKELM